MKKLLISLLAAALIVSGCATARPLPSNTPSAALPTPLPSTAVPVTPTQPPSPTPTAPAENHPDFKNSAYEIEGIQITLVDGLSEIEAAPNSTAKIVTRYFGNEVYGDLNGDGQEDAAFILTQNSGGSGTFFYVVIALHTADGVQGANAVLLGDRIAPQSLSIKDGLITVSYADRKAGEDFSVQPSVGVSKNLQLASGRLVEIKYTSPILNRPWTWVHTQMNDGTLTAPKKADAFTLTLAADGTYSGTTDCNNYFGQYQLEGQQITFGPPASTKMACQDSQESEYLEKLIETSSFIFDSQANTLVLLIKMDSGSLLFK
ncbi:MAG TPA: META domain-containing protein [Anaerolineaceae bacterium]|nr:META domain-containing protein [Anaerolineaceae bacterium]